MYKKRYKKPLLTVAMCLLIAALSLTAIFAGTQNIGNGSAAEITDYNYYKSDFNNSNELWNAALAYNIKICEEGFTLLKNDGLLPMQPKEGQTRIKTSMFGNHSSGLIYCGFGSSDNWKSTTTVYDAFKDSVFELNPKLMSFYDNDSISGKKTDGHASIDAYRVGLPINETPRSAYTQEVIDSYDDYNELAVVFISRTAGEGSDLPMVSLKRDYTERNDANKLNGARNWDDHYLQLNRDEVDMMQMVMDNFDNIVVINNGSSYVELGFLNDPTHYLYTDNNYATDVEAAKAKMSKFKAAINIGMPGSDGIKALPRIMDGTVNPSGHLPDTWVRDMKKDPTYQNFGLSGMKTEELRYGEYYVHYDEDIYMGYRYYETRYVTEGEKGDEWYNDHVMYPLGHGLSYTTFKHELLTTAPGAGATLEKDGTIKVTVRVTNTGNVAGKDTVQLYYNPPYYTGGIAKAHVNLGGFQKTDIIEPGKYEDVTISLKVSDMYSYDWSDANKNGFKGYELDAGDYNIIVASDAHDAAQLPEGRTVKYTIGEGGYQYDKDTTTGADVTNRFDYASGDPSKTNDPETFRGVRQYMSRDDFDGTYPTHASTKQNGMRQKEKIYEINEENDRQMPWYNENMPNYATTPGTSETNEVKLWHMIGRDYDDPLWDELLDQLTIQEMAERIGYGFRGPAALPSIDMPTVWDTDGPLGRRESTDIQWASNPILAATWNTEMAFEQGVLFGNTIFYGNYGKGGTYGVGLDIHRSPFGGRYFEYYSEDGVLSGLMGARVVAGSNTKGCYQVIKHLLLNDQETERNTVSTWASEQAIREIYGKGFEYAVKQGGAISIMTSVNSIGDIPCSVNYALLTELVRGEWGFNGMIITDMHCEDTNASIRAGIDTMMSYPNAQNPATSADKLTSTHVSAMRRALKSIMYTRANSSGVNGVGGERLDRINYVGADALYAVENVDNELTVATAAVSHDPEARLVYKLREGNELPAGMHLNEDGSLSGAPVTSGTYTFSVIAEEDTDALYPYKDVSKTFRMTVYAQDRIPDTIIYEDVDLGVIPYGYDYNKSVKGAVVFDDNGKIMTDISYKLATGSELPRGLELKDGIITGKATASPGTYFFTVEASREGKQAALLDFIVKVKAYSISYEPTEPLPEMAVGKSVTANVGTATSADGVQIKYALKDGSSLPAGLTLQSTGIITGTPTRAYNDYKFTVTASGDLAPTREVTYSVTVKGVVFDDVKFTDLIIGKNYSFKLGAAANNGTDTPVYYELKEGSVLPNGFALLSDGTLVGAGRDWGAQTFTVLAKSEGNVTVEATVTMDFYTIFETPVEGEPSDPIVPAEGCSSSIGGGCIIGCALALAAAFGIVIIKEIKAKKENKK